MVDFKKLRAGSVVYVRTNFGTGPVIRATVTDVEQSVKNGLPGIDYTDESGDGYWAYAEQIVRVQSY
jgi:hypothetical protein